MDQRLMDLEIKLTYLERTVDTLNEVIVELRAQLEQQRKRQLRLEQALLSQDSE